MKAALAALVVLQGLDAGSTTAFLAAGQEESNVLMRAVLDHYGLAGLWMAKALLAGLLVLGCLYLERRGEAGSLCFVLATALPLYTVIITANVITLAAGGGNPWHAGILLLALVGTLTAAAYRAGRQLGGPGYAGTGKESGRSNEG